MDDRDSYEKVRADYEALKAELAAFVMDEATMNRVLADILDLNEDVIRSQIKKRYAAARIKKRMAAIEQRLAALKEKQDA